MQDTVCKKCGNTITSEWRRDKQTIRTKKLEFCSRACANARHQLGDANIKRLQTFANRRVLRAAWLIDNTIEVADSSIKRPAKQIVMLDITCIQCGSTFTTTKSRERKTCSKVCQHARASIHRQNYIKQHGTFATPRETFSYRDVVIEVDSQLEKAGVMYLMDVLSATRIERYNNLINYKDENSNRTFNPDFICMINNKTHIVEVKQLWSGKQEHPYVRTIPLKKAALQQYCETKNYGMIWLDFNETPSLKSTYLDLLKKNAAAKKAHTSQNSSVL